MESPGTWETVIVAILALALVFYLRPGIKAALEKSKKTEEKDWSGVLIPIAIVVLFVIFLIVIQ